MFHYQGSEVIEIIFLWYYETSTISKHYFDMIFGAVANWPLFKPLIITNSVLTFQVLFKMLTLEVFKAINSFQGKVIGQFLL